MDTDLSLSLFAPPLVACPTSEIAMGNIFSKIIFMSALALLHFAVPSLLVLNRSNTAFATVLSSLSKSSLSLFVGAGYGCDAGGDRYLVIQ